MEHAGVSFEPAKTAWHQMIRYEEVEPQEVLNCFGWSVGCLLGWIWYQITFQTKLS
jgi:hypothetical protein